MAALLGVTGAHNRIKGATARRSQCKSWINYGGDAGQKRRSEKIAINFLIAGHIPPPLSNEREPGSLIKAS